MMGHPLKQKYELDSAKDMYTLWAIKLAMDFTISYYFFKKFLWLANA